MEKYENVDVRNAEKIVFQAVRVCLVCNSTDKVSTTFKVCHACHQFFYKYKMLNWDYPKCKYENNCVVDVTDRKCRFCRIAKAKTVGINLDKFGDKVEVEKNNNLSRLETKEPFTKSEISKPKRIRCRKPKSAVIRHCRICNDTDKVTAKKLICHACHQFLYKCHDNSKWAVRPCRNIGCCEISPLIRKCRCCRLVKARNVGVDFEHFGISKQTLVQLEKDSMNMEDQDTYEYSRILIQNYIELNELSSSTKPETKNVLFENVPSDFTDDTDTDTREQEQFLSTFVSQKSSQTN